jgi:hypothetical protein
MVDGARSRLLAVALLASAWGSSATAVEPARHPCAAIADDHGRLACYDAQFGRPAPVQAVAGSSALPAQPASAATAPAVVSGAAVGAAVAAGSSATAAAPVASPDADFGLTQWKKRSLDPATASSAPQRITARVSQVERQRDGRFVVTLDNEQVWQQSETMSRARVAVDDEVTIREASLGSFLLLTANEIATRVRRVK